MNKRKEDLTIQIKGNGFFDKLKNIKDMVNQKFRPKYMKKSDKLVQKKQLMKQKINLRSKLIRKTKI
jgi:hypothetical protein